MKHRLNPLMLAVLAGFVVTPLHAQTAPADDKKNEAAKPEVEVITVTANRRLQDQQKVSGVVTSIQGDQLRKDGVTDIKSLQNVVTGLSIANQEGNLEIYIRGVGTGNNTELGDPSAAPHINGMYIPRPRGLGSMFFDLERVEVNKGPQGTLYGRNAMAGALNIITAKPLLRDFGGYVQADVSSRSSGGVEAALNVPLGDTAAIRGALQTQKRDAGFENVSTAGNNPQLKPAGLEDNVAGRLSLLWRPSAGLKVEAMLDAGREKGTGYPGANVFPAAAATGKSADDLDLRKIRYRGSQGEADNDLFGLQLKTTYEFQTVGVEFSLSRRSVDFYQRNASNDGVDYPGATDNPDNYSTVYWQTKSKSNVGELRFFSTKPDAALKWSAGAFAFDEKQKSAFFSLNDLGAFYSGTEYTMPDVRGKSQALYADGNWAIVNGTRMLGGLRYTKEEKSRYGIGGNYAFGAGGFNNATGADFDCCIGARLGTPGFVPALLDRRTFVLPVFTGPNAKRDRAQAFLDAIKVPGSRDTVVTQIGPIAAGTNENGQCVADPTINPKGLVCLPANNGGYRFASLDGVSIQQQIGASDASYGDFRVGVEHDFAKDTMGYAKVSTGHKSGGFNDTQADGSAPIYKPEKVRVLEAGLRHGFVLGGRRAAVNVTAFDYDYDNYVLQSLACVGINAGTGACAGYSLLNENAAKATVRGLEGELRLPIGSGTRLDLTALVLSTSIKGTVADGRAPNFSGGPGAAPLNIDGNELPQASKLSLTARLQQRFALAGGQFDWQVVATYRSAYYLDHFNNDDVQFLNTATPDPLDVSPVPAIQAGFGGRQKGYWNVNLGAGYDFGNGVRLEGWVTNLLDKQASQKRILGGNFDVRFLTEARSAGMRVRFDF